MEVKKEMRRVVVPIINLKKYENECGVNDIDKLLSYWQEQVDPDLVSIERAINQFAYIFTYKD